MATKKPAKGKAAAKKPEAAKVEPSKVEEPKAATPAPVATPAPANDEKPANLGNTLGNWMLKKAMEQAAKKQNGKPPEAPADKNAKAQPKPPQP